MTVIQPYWSHWVDLSSKPLRPPAGAGLYRVRAADRRGLVYLGQTGRSIRERLQALARGVYGEAPPFNDPHTAAPGLWAWRVEEGLRYSASWAVLDVDRAHRECLEDACLFQQRSEFGESALCNHGRFHSRWTRPSNRGAGRGMERLPEVEFNLASGASLPPPTKGGHPTDRDWLGLSWSEPAADPSSVPKCPGVYRLCMASEVVYLGQSKQLGSRLASHARRHGDLLRFSWVRMDGALEHHLRERETDLIGAAYLALGSPPRLQYAGAQ